MFWIKYKDWDGGDMIDTEVSLPINPTEVEYPETRAAKVLTTQDGATVVQRPRRDSRPRRWIWRGHTPQVAAYATLWALLESLDYRSRLSAGLPGYVEVWEDVSGVGGFARMNGGNRAYTKVKIVQASRAPRPGGGPLSYESVVEFYVDDVNFTKF